MLTPGSYDPTRHPGELHSPWRRRYGAYKAHARSGFQSLSNHGADDIRQHRRHYMAPTPRLPYPAVRSHAPYGLCQCMGYVPCTSIP